MGQRKRLRKTAPSGMSLTAGPYTFDWNSRWGDLPDVPVDSASGRTHGVAIASGGRTVVFRQADPAVLIFDAEGNLLDAWGDRFTGAHGLTLVEEEGEEYLWLTDEDSGEVVKTTLTGETVLSLQCPNLPAYRAGTYSPTWVAVAERRRGGNGDVWVADGYGSNYVHRYDSRGRYLSSLSGEEGAGAFDCPHSVWIDFRSDEPDLFVADRGNRRLQVFDLDGRFKRTVGEGLLEYPCFGMAYEDGFLVPELCARLTLLDSRGQLVGHLGANEVACTLPGWPDLPREHIRNGQFNSPHSAAADAEGNIYVVEWVLGGRLTQLVRR